MKVSSKFSLDVDVDCLKNIQTSIKIELYHRKLNYLFPLNQTNTVAWFMFRNAKYIHKIPFLFGE